MKRSSDHLKDKSRWVRMYDLGRRDLLVVLGMLKSPKARRPTEAITCEVWPFYADQTPRPMPSMGNVSRPNRTAPNRNGALFRHTWFFIRHEWSLRSQRWMSENKSRAPNSSSLPQYACC